MRNIARVMSDHDPSDDLSMCSDLYAGNVLMGMCIVILAAWLFIRPTTTTCMEKMSDRMPDTDTNYDGNLTRGTYGDVTTYFYESPDVPRAKEWQTESGGLYLRNSKTYWRDVNHPDETDFWNKNDDRLYRRVAQAAGVPKKWQHVPTPVRNVIAW